jgi:ubiquitin C-terminal hydrolase
MDNINGIYGLKNLGNTCYLNSIIQTLFNIKILNKFILNKEYISFILHKLDSNLNKNMSTVMNAIIYQIYRLFNTINIGDIEDISLKPTTLRRKLCLKHNIFNNNNQQDAQEAFTLIIEILHSELCQKIDVNIENPTILEKSCLNFWIKEYSPIYDMFHGMYIHTRKCINCNTLITNMEPNLFLDLDIPDIDSTNISDINLLQYIDIKCKFPHIDIPDETKHKMITLLDSDVIDEIKEVNKKYIKKTIKFDIIDCLNDFIKEKTGELSYCSNCNCEQTFNSKCELVIAPRILGVHFKKFDNDLHKINNHISFPINLSIQSIVNQSFNLNQSYNYKLCSVINHVGNTLNSGHYYSYTYSIIHNLWFEYNDEDVSLISEDQIDNKNAYLLFYERCD